jgi:hypothetical protein
MEDYAKLAKERYLAKQKIIIEEETKAKDKIRKMQEEIEKKVQYKKSQLQIIDTSIESYSTDKSDNNIMFIIVSILGVLEAQNLIFLDNCYI